MEAPPERVPRAHVARLLGIETTRPGRTRLFQDSFEVCCWACGAVRRFVANLGNDPREWKRGAAASRSLMERGYLFMRPEGWLCDQHPEGVVRK